MKKIIDTFLLLYLSLSISSCAAKPAIKIMPLGDSTSCASHYKVSYRYPLWKHFVDAGKKVEFVGSQILEGNYGRTVWPEYKGLSFPPANEAHAGWRTDQILDGLPDGTKGLDTWLAGYQPDIALIHLGTNDLDQSQTPESTRDELERLILRLRQNNPRIKVLLAQIIPMGSDSSVARLNLLLPPLAAKLNQADSPVVSVDMYSGFDINTDMQKDKMHPNARGEEIMAKRWFDALVQHCFLGDCKG